MSKRFLSILPCVLLFCACGGSGGTSAPSNPAAAPAAKAASDAKPAPNDTSSAPHVPTPPAEPSPTLADSSAPPIAPPIESSAAPVSTDPSSPAANPAPTPDPEKSPSIAQITPRTSWTLQTGLVPPRRFDGSRLFLAFPTTSAVVFSNNPIVTRTESYAVPVSWQAKELFDNEPDSFSPIGNHGTYDQYIQSEDGKLLYAVADEKSVLTTMSYEWKTPVLSARPLPQELKRKYLLAGSQTELIFLTKNDWRKHRHGLQIARWNLQTNRIKYLDYTGPACGEDDGCSGLGKEDALTYVMSEDILVVSKIGSIFEPVNGSLRIINFKVRKETRLPFQALSQPAYDPRHHQIVVLAYAEDKGHPTSRLATFDVSGKEQAERFASLNEILSARRDMPWEDQWASYKLQRLAFTADRMILVSPTGGIFVTDPTTDQLTGRGELALESRRTDMILSTDIGGNGFAVDVFSWTGQTAKEKLYLFR